MRFKGASAKVFAVSHENVTPLAATKERPNKMVKPAGFGPVLVPDISLPRRFANPSVVSGFFPKAVGASLLGATSLIGIIAPTAAHAQDTQPIDPRVARDALDLSLRADSMTPEELATARRELYSSYVTSTTTSPIRTRGETVWESALADIETRMEVTAYDLAHPGSYTPIEGHPGYKAVPADELRHIVTSALKDVPLNELPGGHQLAALIRTLPGTSSLNVEQMSYNQLRHALSDTGKAYLDQHFKPFLSKHKVELAIGGFGAITAIRAASPEAAGILDKIIPKIEIWDGNIGPISGEASLRYRDRNLLPDVDITAISARTVGAVDLRATATGTISVNGDEHVTGILGVGARTGTTRGWVDLSGSVSTESRAGVLLSAGLDHPEDRLIVRGDLGVTTGPGFNGGRVDSTVTLEKKIRMDGGRVTGSFGLFGGAGVDLDGKNEDVRGGLMLRLRW